MDIDISKELMAMLETAIDQRDELERVKAENEKLCAEVEDLEKIDAEEITSWQALWEYLRKSFPDAPKGEHSPQEIVDWARKENEKLREHLQRIAGMKGLSDHPLVKDMAQVAEQALAEDKA